METVGRLAGSIAHDFMPRLGGDALALVVREKHPTMPVLFMSGYASEALAETHGLSPDVHFIGKPFAPEVLARKVRAILGSSGRSRLKRV